MITIETLIKHMGWANHRMLTELAALPDECLAATYGPEDWNVARIATHIAGGNEWYAFLLSGQQWTDLKPPTSGSEVLVLRDYISSFTQYFLEQAALPDATIEFTDEYGPHTSMRSVVLSQAIYHSTEHRAHIATAIEVQGISKIDLDSYDVWAYDSSK
jgi:uncharacterized damage-inducible protein DinB